MPDVHVPDRLAQYERERVTLDDLRAKRAEVEAELKAIASNPSPWYAGERYIADERLASVERGRLIAAKLAHLDRLDNMIAYRVMPDEIDQLWAATDGCDPWGEDAAA